VEAVKFSGTGGGNNQKKRPELQKVTLGALAKINLSRAKGRTIGIVTSLSVSGALLIGFMLPAFSFIGSVESIIGRGMLSDMQVLSPLSRVSYGGSPSMVGMDDPGIPEELIEKIRAINGVLSVEAVYQKDTMQMGEEKTMGGISGVTVIGTGAYAGVSAEVLQHYIDRSDNKNLTLADFSDPHNVIAVLEPHRYLSQTNDTDFTQIFKTGNTVNALMFSAFDEIDWMFSVFDEIDISGEGTDFNIVGVVTAGESEMTYAQSGNLPGLYTLSDSIAAAGWNVPCSRLFLEVDDNMHNAVYSELTTLTASHPELEVYSLKHAADLLRNQLMSIALFALLLICVVAFVGILNLAGSMFMSVEQRKREIGILLAVGLSRKAADKLIKYEGYRISAMCIALSCAIGFPVGYLLYTLINSEMNAALAFSFPLTPFAAFCLVYALAPALISGAAVKRLRKFTTTELLGRQT
jgi:ABC-type antimicrobial peptide transport system permease subunit